MKHLIIAAVSLTSVTTPVVADRHCQAPDIGLPNYDVIRSLQEGDSYTQAHDLTHRSGLLDWKRETVETCEANPANFDFNCDVASYVPTLEINPTFLNLSEADFDAQLRGISDEAYLLDERLKSCREMGKGGSDG